ncbi:S-layer homology domain-containing protein [Paenibacillus eucommiae]|nr:S-layer homology domain-containing protein [Paenibacillus eucommiae]
MIWNRVFLVVMMVMLLTTSWPMGTNTSYAQADESTIFFDNFESGEAAAWTPESGTWAAVNSTGGILFSDEFENGSAAGWTNTGGEWSSVQGESSKVYQQSSINGGAELIAGSNAWTDYSFEADVKLISGTGAMLEFRHQDNQHFYYLYMSESYIRLMKQNGSAQEWLKAYDGPSLDVSRFVHLKIDVTGNQIRVFKDGDLVIETTDDNGYFSSGKVALASWASSAQFDDVAVTDLSANQVYSQTESSGGFSHTGNSTWADYSVQAQVMPTAISEDGTVGLSLRYQDSLNRYALQYMEAGKIQIIKVVNGVETALSEAAFSMENGKSYTFKGVAGGKYIDFYINGVKLLSVEDKSFATGKIALNMSQAAADFDNIEVQKVLAPVNSEGHSAYYVSSSTGDDANDGLSAERAWKTLNKINISTFRAGDSILLKSGDAWNEPLVLKGSGSKEYPITVSSYGSGDKPVISWNAPNGGSVVTGYNLSHWTIKGLAVNILTSSTLSWSNITVGINVIYDNAQRYENLRIEENEVYSANYNSNSNGIMISAWVPGTDNKEVVTGVSISNNEIHHVGWYGITTSGWDPVKSEELRSQVLYGNFKISGNYVHHTASQGIVLQNAHNSVIERNVVHDGGLGVDTWGPGGLWIITSRDSVIKFNEVYNMKDAGSGYDGSGVNVDWHCDNITVQYNYSHDNKGNGITTMSNYGTKIWNNKVRGNQGQQANGNGQIALGNFTGRPDLSSGEHDLDVANNMIIVDIDNTAAINSASNPHGTWTGNKIYDNHIAIARGITNFNVFDIAPNTNFDVIDHNYVANEALAFSSIYHGTTYTGLASWQQGTGFEGNTQVLPIDESSPSTVNQVTATLDGYAELSWSAGEDQGNGILHYNIYRSEDAAFTPAYSNMVGESATTSFIDREEAKPNTTYYYKVEAEDRSGNVGAASEAVHLTTGPTVPETGQPKIVDFVAFRDGYQLNVVDLPTMPYIAGIQPIQKVELYVDDRLIQEMTASPYAYTIKGLSNGEHTLQYKVYDMTGSVTESRRIKVYKQVAALRSLFTQSKPMIDGSIQEWGKPEFVMNQRAQVKSIESTFTDQWSPQRLNASGHTRWDDDNLYIAIKVREGVHRLPITNAADLWKGSSIQIAIDPDRGAVPGSKGYTEFAFGLTDEGQAVGYRYNAIAGKAAGEFTAGEMEISRDDVTKSTSYELSIPWGEIIPGGISVKDGSVLGISLLANYSDGSFINSNNGDARNGWIEYNSGIGAGKAPIQYGYFILGKQIFETPTISAIAGNGEARLSWGAVAGAAGYTIKYGTASGLYSSKIDAGSVTHHTVSGLTKGMTYYFIAEAYDAYGESGPSNEVAIVALGEEVDGSGSGSSGSGSSGSQAGNVRSKVEIKDGAAQVKLEKGQSKAVVLLSEIGNYPLQVHLGKVSITVSQESLDNLREQSGFTAGSVIEVTMSPITDSAILNAPASGSKATVKIAGEVYDFEVKLKTADNREIATGIVLGGITLSLPYDSGQVDQKLLGIYYFDKTKKQWEYAGGEIDEVMNQVKVTLQHLSVYSVMEYNRTFSDVKDDYWAKRVLQILAAKHIVNGVDESRFDPEGKMTRAEFVTLLANALNLESGGANNTFIDVKTDAWYADSVAAAVKAGITSGISVNQFAPDKLISRAEMVVMIVRSAGIQPKSMATVSYADAHDIPGWALPYVAAAGEANLVQGRGSNLFAPQSKATRAEAAQLVYNLLNK